MAEPVSTGTMVLGGINAAANVASALGGFFGGGQEGLSRDDQRFMAHKAWNLADDQFYRGMQIRSRDAEAAGLHPLAALGVAPSSVSSSTAFAPQSKPSLGDRLNNMGQNISRAISAYQTPEERELARIRLRTEKANATLAEENAKAAIKANLDQPGTPPAAPGVPSMQRWYNPVTNKVEWGYTPEYAASIMSSPVTMYSKDLKRILGSYESGGFPWHGLWNEFRSATHRLNPLNWWDMRKRR